MAQRAGVSWTLKRDFTDGSRLCAERMWLLAATGRWSQEELMFLWLTQTSQGLDRALTVGLEGIISSDDGYWAWHSDRTVIHTPHSSFSNRVAVYVDYPAGPSTVSDTLIHPQTFNCSFTKPLHPVEKLGLFMYSLYHVCLMKGMWHLI